MSSARERAPESGELRHLRAADARRVPWKNGRGFTHELALWPPGANFEGLDFDWRLSAAVVDEPGPFSRFPGFERVLVVTSGAGLALDHGADAPPARVPRLQPYAFSGDWATSAALVEGPVADFNVLARRGVTTRLAVHRLAGRQLSETLGPGHGFVHVLAGQVEIRAANREFALAAGESLWLVESPTPRRLELSGSGETLAVHLPAGP